MFQSPATHKASAIEVSSPNVMSITVEMATCVLMFVMASLLMITGQYLMAVIGSIFTFVAWSFFYKMHRLSKRVVKYFDEEGLSLLKDIRMAQDVNRRLSSEMSDTVRGNAALRVIFVAMLFTIAAFTEMSTAHHVFVGAAFATLSALTALFAFYSARKVMVYAPTQRIIGQLQEA